MIVLGVVFFLIIFVYFFFELLIMYHVYLYFLFLALLIYSGCLRLRVGYAPAVLYCYILLFWGVGMCGVYFFDFGLGDILDFLFHIIRGWE